MSPALLANIVVVLHLLYAAFVVSGFLAIPAGWTLGWGWVRGRTYRLLHLAATAFVGLQAAIGMVCPLTTLEYHLRRTAGQEAGEGAFIARWASRLLYYDFPPWVFVFAYLLLTAIALLMFFALPPRKRKRSKG
ncbi:MAG: DUF2784 domain-containing protein [SAR324 cluster bacterium]|nr:DUF2784 domain-containing protein [SAR324 cluster bacterium]MCZ6534268.1 DUF2784 domain-containing protein [SAR324 cluster bacterium]MCZ6843732.1 DUF2784 domain-containing protein [SAR324 cluster bacterium]